MNKIQLEKIDFPPGKSFKVFSPRLRNTFLWHYHPEFELVFVEASAGIRHVGTHISTYTESDLVFIGGNLPHLNFDYRQRSYADYRQTVIQLRTDFLGTAIGIAPEMKDIAELFKRAEYGIAFYGSTKREVGLRLPNVETGSSLEQLGRLVAILQMLATSSETVTLNTDLTSKDFILQDKIRMGAIYEYIDAEYANKPDVNQVAKKINLTTPAFCRYFKRQTNMTFTEFVNQYRIERAKNLLTQGKNVGETCYAVGFENLSYFTKVFKEITGGNPSDFRERYHWDL